MCEVELKTLLLGLKSADKEKIYCILLKIRNSITTDAKGIQQFYKAGGLKLLVDLLKYPNQKNLDLTLSILGNCCIQENCSLAVGGLKVSELLVNIIKNIASDSILCRACRLIANLSTQKENAEYFHSAGVVWALVGILQNYVEIIEQPKESTATIAMAIRALGILWTHENCRDDIISVGTIKFIVSILAYHEIQKNSAILGFAHVILKTLVTMTTLSRRDNNSTVSDYLASQICSEKGIIDVITGIINKNYENTDHKESKQIKLNSKLALTLLYNLCHLDQCRDMLGKSTALTTLINKVDSEEGFNGLILLCRDIKVHAKARTSGALRVLLKSVDKSGIISTSKRKISLVLDVLSQYILDKNIIFDLVEDGLITVLITVMNCYLKKVNCLDKSIKNCKHTCSSHPKCNADSKSGACSEKSKVKRNHQTKCDTAVKRLLMDGDNAQFTYYLSSIPSSPCNSSKALWSPQSDSTGYASMDATPPRRDSLTDDDFESYSPVCSDNEGEADFTKDEGLDVDDYCPSDVNKVTVIDEMYDQDECNSTINQDDETLNDFETKEDCNRDILTCVRLLQQITFYGCIIPQLAQAETIISLLKFLIESTQGIKYVIYAVNEILGRVEYLKTLLKTDLVLEMYNIINANVPECSQCIKIKDRIIKLRNKLQITAESACGVGEIENILCLGTMDLRRKYILNISLLIDSAIILRKILFKFGALEILLNLLDDPIHKKKGFVSIHKLCKNT